MAGKLFVELVSVEARIWSGEAVMVVARTIEGEVGVLPGHAPLLGQLNEPSRVRAKLAGPIESRAADEVAFDVTGGFLSVTNAGVTILAETARPAQGEDPAALAALRSATSDSQGR